MSNKSSVLTPTYFNLVSIDILEYAFLQIFLVFCSQLRSSLIHSPRSFVTEILSNWLSLILKRVVKLVLDLEKIMKLHFASLSFIRCSFDQLEMQFRLFCNVNFSVGRYFWSNAISDAIWSIKL